MKKGASFWLGMVLLAGGVGLWGYRVLWASVDGTCAPVSAYEFAPLT